MNTCDGGRFLSFRFAPISDFGPLESLRMGRDSSDGLATRYGAGWSGDRIPIGASFSAFLRTRHWSPYSFQCNGCRVSFLGVKRPGLDVDHPLPSSTKVKNTRWHKKKLELLNAYVEMLQSFVAPALNNFPQLHEAWFHQDGATSHIARQSMAAVRELFGNHVISRFGDIPWPPKITGFARLWFFLVGLL